VKGFIVALCMVSLLPLSSWAACDFSTIKKVSSGYLYSGECHKEVGDLKHEAETRRGQVDKLNNSIKLKDLAIKTHEERVVQWRDTSLKLEDRVRKQAKWGKVNDVMHFLLGVGVSGLAVWGASRLNR